MRVGSLMTKTVAKVGLSNYTKDKGQMKTLKQIMEGLSHMHHNDPRRVALKHKQIHYSCDTLSKQTIKKEITMEVSAYVGDERKSVFQKASTSVRTTRGDPRRWRRPWRPKQLPEHNYRRPKEMTEVEKAKVDLIKNLQKNLLVMERDQRTFIRLAAMDKSKLPTSLHPLLSKYHKINTSQITILVNTLHEIKPLDLNHVDIDKYQKLVDKILEVRGEYMECMKIGEALAEDDLRPSPHGAYSSTPFIRCG